MSKVTLEKNSISGVLVNCEIDAADRLRFSPYRKVDGEMTYYVKMREDTRQAEIIMTKATVKEMIYNLNLMIGQDD